MLDVSTVFPQTEVFDVAGKPNLFTRFISSLALATHKTLSLSVSLTLDTKLTRLVV